MRNRFFIVINMHPDGGLLGVHAAAADPKDAETLWASMHNEEAFCADFIDAGALPEPGEKGMYCICGAHRRDASVWTVDDGPAPSWRRPTAAEMVWLVTGDTPPSIQAWLDE